MENFRNIWHTIKSADPRKRQSTLSLAFIYAILLVYYIGGPAGVSWLVYRYMLLDDGIFGLLIVVAFGLGFMFLANILANNRSKELRIIGIWLSFLWWALFIGLAAYCWRSRDRRVFPDCPCPGITN